MTEKYKKILELYFERCNVDVDKMLKQDINYIENLIKNDIVPNWKNTLQTTKLHKELEKYKFVEHLRYKEYISEMLREKRSDIEIRNININKIKKENEFGKKSKLEKFIDNANENFMK